MSLIICNIYIHVCISQKRRLHATQLKRYVLTTQWSVPYYGHSTKTERELFFYFYCMYDYHWINMCFDQSRAHFHKLQQQFFLSLQHVGVHLPHHYYQWTKEENCGVFPHLFASVKIFHFLPFFLCIDSCISSMWLQWVGPGRLYV